MPFIKLSFCKNIASEWAPAKKCETCVICTSLWNASACELWPVLITISRISCQLLAWLLHGWLLADTWNFPIRHLFLDQWFSRGQCLETYRQKVAGGGRWEWDFSCGLESISNTASLGYTITGTKAVVFVFLDLENEVDKHWKMPKFCHVEQ